MEPLSPGGRYRLGGLLLLQLAGLIIPFVLILPLTGDARSILLQAAPHATQVRLAAGWLVANGIVTLAISLHLYSARPSSGTGPGSALIVAASAMLLLQVMDSSCLLGLLSLSEQSAGDATGSSSLEVATIAVRAVRRWSHMYTLVAVDAWVATFYLFLLRAATRPGRFLAACGLVTACMHFVGVPMPQLVGRASFMPLAYWMAATHVAMAAWLIWGRGPVFSPAVPRVAS